MKKTFCIFFLCLLSCKESIKTDSDIKKYYNKNKSYLNSYLLDIKKVNSKYNWRILKMNNRGGGNEYWKIGIEIILDTEKKKKLSCYYDVNKKRWESYYIDDVVNAYPQLLDTNMRSAIELFIQLSPSTVYFANSGTYVILMGYRKAHRDKDREKGLLFSTICSEEGENAVDTNVCISYY